MKLNGDHYDLFIALSALQRHPDGVASVAFKEPDEADACIQSFNGRWFGGRQLSVQLWDGKTDYQVNHCRGKHSVTCSV